MNEKAEKFSYDDKCTDEKEKELNTTFEKTKTYAITEENVNKKRNEKSTLNFQT